MEIGDLCFWFLDVCWKFYHGSSQLVLIELLRHRAEWKLLIFCELKITYIRIMIKFNTMIINFPISRFILICIYLSKI